MLAKNTHDEYRKYPKNNKCNKIPDLERKEAERFQLAKKYPCYFCDFCGHFGVLLGFFCFQVLILVRFVISAIFAICVSY